MAESGVRSEAVTALLSLQALNNEATEGGRHGFSIPSPAYAKAVEDYVATHPMPDARRDATLVKRHARDWLRIPVRSRRVVVVRCAGEREGSSSDGWPFVDALVARSARNEVEQAVGELDVRLEAYVVASPDREDLALMAQESAGYASDRGLPTTGVRPTAAEMAGIRREVGQTLRDAAAEGEPPDAYVYLSGPGTHHMNLGALLACADAAADAGAPLYAGSITEHPPSGGSEVRVEHVPFALLPGWDKLIRNAARAHLGQLEFSAAAGLLRSGPSDPPRPGAGALSTSNHTAAVPAPT